MKKKTPPYAIIGAALLGIVAIFAFVKYKQGQDAQAAAAIAKAQADRDALQKELDDKNNQPAAPTANANTRMVYYATQPVEAGAKISSAFYEKKATPVDILPDAFSEKDDIIGFYAVRNIEKGDPLTPRNIGKSLPQMSTRISPGMRALSLSVFNAENNNTGGFAVDGDMVDLLFTSMIKGAKFKTEMVLQNVKILYIPGPKIESEQVNGVVPAPPPGDQVAVTFEVTPEQAQALVLLSNSSSNDGFGGYFSMILRAKSDKSQIKIKPFEAYNYVLDLKKVQTMSDKSDVRVKALAEQIAAQVAAEQKTQAAASQGTTNETTNPTPPTP